MGLGSSLQGGRMQGRKTAGVGRTHNGVAPRLNLGAAEVLLYVDLRLPGKIPFSYLPLLPKEGFRVC